MPYVADLGLSTSIFLALRMGKALMCEGEPGVGKTEVAKVLSRVFSDRARGSLSQGPFHEED